MKLIDLSANVPAYEEIQASGYSSVAAAELLGKEESQQFVIGQFEIQPGGYTVSHSHADEQLHYVLDGTGSCVVDGVEQRLKAGDLLLVHGGEEHQLRNNGEAPFRFLAFFA